MAQFCNDKIKLTLKNLPDKPGIAGQRFVVGVSTPYVASDAAGLKTIPAAVIERYYPGIPSLLEEIGITIPSMPFFYSHEKARTQLGFRSSHDLGDIARLYKQWQGMKTG